MGLAQFWIENRAKVPFTALLDILQKLTYKAPMARRVMQIRQQYRLKAIQQ